MELFKHASEALFWTASAASIVGLLLPATGWKARLMHVVYGVFIAVLAVGVSHYRGRVAETERIEARPMRLHLPLTDLGMVIADSCLLRWRSWKSTRTDCLTPLREHERYATTQGLRCLPNRTLVRRLTSVERWPRLQKPCGPYSLGSQRASCEGAL
jgi:hypothetical protein